VGFGTGLNPGSFTIVTLTSLSGLGINLTTTDVLVTQTVTSFTGAATKFGVAFADPPTVGSSLLPSPNTCYVSASDIGGGVAGYAVIGAPFGNIDYRINVSATPVELSRFTVE
jgi:hypothetical protein